MVATALLLPVAFALLATDVSAASSLPAFSQRALRDAEASVSASSSEDVSVGDFAVTSQYKTCQDGAPTSASIFQGCGSGEIDECVTGNSVGQLTYSYSTVTSCGTDIDSIIEQLFGNETYLRMDYFYDDDCTSWWAADVFLVTGECIEQLGYDESEGDTSYLPVVNANGSATWARYYGDDCSGDAVNASWIDVEQLSSNACIDKMKWYTNAAASTTVDGSDGSTGSSSNNAPHSVGMAASEFVIACIAVLSVALTVAI
jgi:hypothetical protein